MYNRDSNPVLTDCTFIENSAISGGGMCNKDSDVELNTCEFIRNTTSVNGGAIRTDSGQLIAKGCVFEKNSLGAIEDYSTSGSMFTNCTFTGNSSRDRGGAVCAYEATFSNCIFAGNRAFGYYWDGRWHPGSGGAVFNWWTTVFNNCTFIENRADLGCAIHCIGTAYVNNCIFWSSENQVYIDDPSAAPTFVRYSNVQGGCEGESNIDIDPLFVDPGYWTHIEEANVVVEPNDPNAVWVNGDYHLKSQAGRWDPNSQSWVQDDVTSPCIDAGDPNSDWTGEIWPHGERINMGAYGGTREAGMSTQPQIMSLPTVAYIYLYDTQAAESFRSFLGGYGCSTTLIELGQVATAPLDSYELILVAGDTQYMSTWTDPQTVAAIETCGKPVVGLGDGGYDFFGLLGLSIGNPYGGHGSKNSIEVIDPNSSLFSMPYSIEIPQDRVLQLYTETHHVGIYLWPTIPETVTVFGNEENDIGYYPLVAEHNRYMLWGFSESPEYMTDAGRTLFINVVIWTANAGWDFVDETENGTEDIWWILEGQDYPRLWWELIPEN